MCPYIIFVDYTIIMSVKVGEVDEPSKLAFDALFQSPEDAVPIEQQEWTFWSEWIICMSEH